MGRKDRLPFQLIPDVAGFSSSNTLPEKNADRKFGRGRFAEKPEFTACAMEIPSDNRKIQR